MPATRTGYFKTKPPPPMFPVRFTLDAQVGDYTIDREVTRYVYRSGKVQIPVAAADGTDAEIVQRHAAAGGKVVFFVVERVGLMPLVPGPETEDSNAVLLDGEMLVDKPAIMMDGSRQVWHVEGWYAYAFKDPVWVTTATGLPVGSKVTDRTPPGDNVIPAAAFVDNTAAQFAKRAPGDNPATIRDVLTPEALAGSRSGSIFGARAGTPRGLRGNFISG